MDDTLITSREHNAGKADDPYDLAATVWRSRLGVRLAIIQGLGVD